MMTRIPAWPTYLQESASSPSWKGCHRLALGTAGLGGIWGRIHAEESVNTILFALERGITVVDTAPAYQDAERYIGQALAQWKGTKPFISTKVGRLKGRDALATAHDFSPVGMRRSLLDSLETLGVEKTDLLLLHEPEFIPSSQREGAVAAAHQFQSEGLAGSIGLGGNVDENFAPFLRQSRFAVILGFNHLNACNLDALMFEVPLVREHKMAFYQGSPLHMGLLGNRFERYCRQPPKWIDAASIEIAKKVKAIAEANEMSLSSLAHRFLFSVAEVDRVVIGPRNLVQLETTLQDWRAGPLSRDLFDEVCQAILERPA